MALYKFASGLRNALQLATSRNLASRNNSTFKDCKDRLRDMHVPDKPKKPLTPYFRFLKDFRQDIVKTKPNVKVTELVKQAAADWPNVHATVKDKYTAEYKHEMQDYTAKMLAYNAQLTPEMQENLKEARKLKSASKKKRQIRKKNKAFDKPKRPLGPYMQFLLEKSKGNKEEKMVDLMQQLKGQYQSLHDADKQRYIQLFEDDKKRYELQMKEWEQRMIAEGHEDLVRQASLRRSKGSRLTAALTPKKQ